MLTVSLHDIRIHAPHGLYPQEHILGNLFDVDVDVFVPVPDAQQWPFIDYTLIRKLVAEVFNRPGQLLETFVQLIWKALREQFPEAEKIKVAVRKLRPPMPGDVGFAEVCYEG
ncbi:dihydroneopterin aldolase [Chitinophagaceae bacterium MMS25-I14]